MKRVAVVIAACSILCVCSGCFRTVYRADDLPFNASMQRSGPNESYVRHFEESKWNHYFIFALVPTSEPDMRRLIGRNVGQGQEVRNLQIKHEMTFLNGLVAVFVGGLYNPLTTTVSGDVVQVNAAP